MIRKGPIRDELGREADLLMENPIRKLEMGGYHNAERIQTTRERGTIRGAVRGQESVPSSQRPSIRGAFRTDCVPPRRV